MSAPTASQVARWLASAGALLEQCEWKGQRIKLDRWQQAFLKDTSRGQSITKSRQIGGSLALAGRGLVRAMIQPHSETIFVSYTQAEATKLVKYVRGFWETAPAVFKRPLVTDSATQLEWKDSRGWARVVAKASKNARGESGADFVWDEAAFTPEDDAVFSAAAPLLVHGNSQLTMASTAFGARGLHHEIAMNHERRYNAFSRMTVPWWGSAFLCTDPKAAVAWLKANPGNTIEDRIAMFGNDAARVQWELMGFSEDRWLQEYECRYESGFGALFSRESLMAVSEDYDVLDDVHAMTRPIGLVFGGFDIGAVKDKSELVMFELDGNDHARLIFRRTLPVGMPLADQESWIVSVLDACPWLQQLRIDATGLGRQLAFSVASTERFRGRVAPIVVTAEIKQEMCEGFRGRVQAKRVTLPIDRELHGQLHSIKRQVSQAGRITYVTPSTKHGHADAAWATLFAAPRLDALAQSDAGLVTCKILGRDDDDENAANSDDDLPEGRLFRYAR